MKSYQHTQNATELVVVMALISLVSAVAAVLLPWCLITTVLTAFAAWLFRSLTVEITDTELRWWFGPGWVAKRVALSEIASARVVRTSFPEGWGIHYSRFGWLYNVQGFGAVAISLRNGKRFCLGSDEPEALASALNG